MHMQGVRHIEVMQKLTDCTENQSSLLFLTGILDKKLQQLEWRNSALELERKMKLLPFYYTMD